jgi:pSer/pThr/pTyr-binding forkhead associated (FHA) protein
MRLSANTDQRAPADIAASTHPASRESCPICKTERDEPQSAFCGVCGYNFVTRLSGDVVPETAPAPPAVANTTTAPPQRVNSASAAPHIEIEVTFDESNVEAPKGAPPRKFSLYDEESLIGRRSNSIPQTVGLEGDDGVSRRHLLIIRQADGSYVARLFDNTNGGTLNVTEMIAGVEAPLAEGDKIAIGAFTILRVNAIR